ncbi:MAG: hypothetical protein HY939_01565 [Gammaproteobacteria bacterium]|nr:hypothetical protein [Gammaproteobacteria bacterium]
MVSHKPFLELSRAEIEKVMGVNFLSPCMLMQKFGARMIAQQAQGVY